MNYGGIIQDTSLVGNGVTTIVTPATELLLPISEGGPHIWS